MEIHSPCMYSVDYCRSSQCCGVFTIHHNPTAFIIMPDSSSTAGLYCIVNSRAICLQVFSGNLVEFLQGSSCSISLCAAGNSTLVYTMVHLCVITAVFHTPNVQRNNVFRCNTICYPVNSACYGHFYPCALHHSLC